jgi:hypothetical protein
MVERQDTVGLAQGNDNRTPREIQTVGFYGDRVVKDSPREVGQILDDKVAHISIISLQRQIGGGVAARFQSGQHSGTRVGQCGLAIF